ncbi:hypothetical protein RRG08_028770 [Elysia crispata]|uniref:Uncharacterized protein n=1 Tax=Elysia crispata TaxID=231223 RepID=A0AAE0ZMG9_9GAST|nr:hypothetical protein RRG08_028770 [Elysia crispata]
MFINLFTPMIRTKIIIFIFEEGTSRTKPCKTREGVAREALGKTDQRRGRRNRIIKGLLKQIIQRCPRSGTGRQSWI